ncbi:MAG TPA: hypothetical protein EYP31_10155 [Roseibacterium sp.]|nr:hypothetical protein [Roseibacterium sp.]
MSDPNDWSLRTTNEQVVNTCVGGTRRPEGAAMACDMGGDWTLTRRAMKAEGLDALAELRLS